MIKMNGRFKQLLSQHPLKVRIALFTFIFLVIIAMLFFGIRITANAKAASYKDDIKAHQKSLSQQVDDLDSKYTATSDRIKAMPLKTADDKNAVAKAYEQSLTPYYKELNTAIKKADDTRPKLGSVFLGSFASGSYQKMKKTQDSVNAQYATLVTYSYGTYQYYSKLTNIRDAALRISTIATAIGLNDNITTELIRTADKIGGVGDETRNQLAESLRSTIKYVPDAKKIFTATSFPDMYDKDKQVLFTAADGYVTYTNKRADAFKSGGTKALIAVMKQTINGPHDKFDFTAKFNQIYQASNKLSDETVTKFNKLNEQIKKM